MSDAQTLSDASVRAVRSAGESVVRIASGCHGGSGVVFSSDGVVVTALHLVGSQDNVEVTLGDGRALQAKVVGRDPGTDLAALRLDATGLPTAAWSDGEGLAVGQIVIPLGRPGRTVRAAFGMISALGDAWRTHAGATVDRFVDVDGSLPRGFSGGPLVDLGAQVIGVNTAALTRGGTTLPTTTVKRVVGELLAHGSIAHGYLGVGGYPVRLPEALANSLGQKGGIVVVGVEPGSPAGTAGVLIGDVLARVDGTAVEHPGALRAALHGKARTEVKLTLARGGELRELSVTAGERT